MRLRFVLRTDPMPSWLCPPTLHPFPHAQEEIKKAYRKLAMRYHPDKNAGDEAAKVRFQAISEAYSLLSNYRGRFTLRALRERTRSRSVATV